MDSIIVEESGPLNGKIPIAGAKKCMFNFDACNSAE